MCGKMFGMWWLTRGIFVASLGIGCSTAPAATPDGFSVEALQSLPSRGDQYRVEIRTSPQPPTRGELSVEYAITSNATGAPASGLALQVVPWMPAMGHGTSVVPTVAEASPGTYVITNVDLFMAGQWVLRTTIARMAAIDCQRKEQMSGRLPSVNVG